MSGSDDENAVDEYTSLIASRRPSIMFLDTPLGSFKGPNSLHNFASSFTRAQSFAVSKIDNDIHRARSFFVENIDTDADDELFDPELMIPSQKGERLSVVIHDISSRNQLFMNNVNELDQNISPNNDVFYHDDILSALNESRSRHNSTYNTPGAIPISKKRVLPSPSFSSIRSALSLATTSDHINLKKIEDKDGNVVTVLAGQSTAPQTIFNSINVLIGVGLLALPVGILKAGWYFGIPILVICGLATFWTAGLLSKCMDTDPTIMTYADLGYAAYGSTAKLLISLLFSIDLFGSRSDEEVWTRTRFKFLSFVVLTPFTFVPLPVLSIFSLFGILSTISITILVAFCGILKTDSPGSLLAVMPTNIWPQSLPDLLLAIGILMAPFGDMAMGVLGFLMFGHKCSNEITNTLLLTSGYPAWCYPLISGLICLIPLAKTPLNAKPIISTLDRLHLSLNLLKDVGKFFIRVGVNAVFVLLAILFPEFDKIIGILGASICFVICIVLPCLFYLKLCSSKMGALERVLIQFVVFFTSILAVVATWAVVQF
ncbi:hypothetical protein G9P44_006149 [Scheffersomyces stipitis]|nr:hypothetical protein G9P44_006149 [Scheffersomyces stipitis]